MLDAVEGGHVEGKLIPMHRVRLAGDDGWQRVGLGRVEQAHDPHWVKPQAQRNCTLYWNFRSTLHRGDQALDDVKCWCWRPQLSMDTTACYLRRKLGPLWVLNPDLSVQFHEETLPFQRLWSWSSQLWGCLQAHNFWLVRGSDPTRNFSLPPAPQPNIWSHNYRLLQESFIEEVYSHPMPVAIQRHAHYVNFTAHRPHEANPTYINILRDPVGTATPLCSHPPAVFPEWLLLHHLGDWGGTDGIKWKSDMNTK